MGKYRISGVPIVDNKEDRNLVGILTNRDLRFIEDFSIKIVDNDARKFNYSSSEYNT